jgi:NAD(P)-dependent dehydrogenase (short-subunit alcohol dehydrogenase family)
MSELRFDGRVALVTGAGGGLGREHALLLGARGAKVVANDIGGVDREAQKNASAERTAEDIRAAGGSAIANTDSVASSEGGRAMLEATLAEFGRIDIVVHNAGVGRVARRFEDLPDEQLEIILRTHLFGAFNTLRPAWRVMKDQHYGRIVNTSSATALGVEDSWDYPAAKGGLVSLTRSLALTGQRHDIKVNAIMPMAYTPMAEQIPNEEIRKWMEVTFPASIVAPTVALLCHERAPCSGETFSVGGGRTGRVTYAVSPGYKHENATPESILANWEQVMSSEGQVLATCGADDSNLFQAGYDAVEHSRIQQD